MKDISAQDLRSMLQGLQGIVAAAGKLIVVYGTIEGMVAENKQREACGHSMAYRETCFGEATDTAEAIVREIREIVTW